MTQKGMPFREGWQMFEGFCQEASNRMVDFGVPEATFSIRKCPGDDKGIHLQVRKRGEVLSEFHIWSEGDSFHTPSEYEEFFKSICQAIRQANGMGGAVIMMVSEDWSDRFGPPSHGGILN